MLREGALGWEDFGEGFCVRCVEDVWISYTLQTGAVEAKDVVRERVDSGCDSRECVPDVCEARR